MHHRATPDERSLGGRVAAHTLHAAGKTNTEDARRKFLARFEAEVDPESVLPPPERKRRAKHALKAHMARLALRSVAARRKAKILAEEAAVAEEELSCWDGPDAA